MQKINKKPPSNTSWQLHLQYVGFKEAALKPRTPDKLLSPRSRNPSATIFHRKIPLLLFACLSQLRKPAAPRPPSLSPLSPRRPHTTATVWQLPTPKTHVLPQQNALCVLPHLPALSTTSLHCWGSSLEPRCPLRNQFLLPSGPAQHPQLPSLPGYFTIISRDFNI